MDCTVALGQSDIATLSIVDFNNRPVGKVHYRTDTVSVTVGW